MSNDGPVISRERLRTLFEPRRGSTASRSADGRRGVGLGLYMVKTIAEAHGGSVTVESNPKSGTTFTVRLPIDIQPEATGDATLIEATK